MKMHVFHRRNFLTGVAGLMATRALAGRRPDMTVHRSATCGCCLAWVRHVQRAGYSVTIINESDLAPIKTAAGVPAALQSCHTAFIDGYVIEGHVPVEAIEKLLAERPPILGLAVPEMPTGSPGMEMPGQRPEPFSVMMIPKSGSPAIFLDYPAGYRRSS